MKKGVLTNFTKFTGLRPATLFKKRLLRSSFPVNFAKFLRTPFLYNISGQLLLTEEYLSIKSRYTHQTDK